MTRQRLVGLRSRWPVSWKTPSAGKESRSLRRELFSVSPPKSLAAPPTPTSWPSVSSTWPTSRDRPLSPRPRRRRPLLRLQSGPPAGRVGPLRPPLLKGDEAQRAPALQVLRTRISFHNPQKTILIYRSRKIAQIPRPMPSLRRPWPTPASPASLCILPRVRTVGPGRTAIAIPRRSILAKTRELHLCPSPHAFPTFPMIQRCNPTIRFDRPLLFPHLDVHTLSCASSNPLSGDLSHSIPLSCTDRTF
jgi:hypothetical protein